MPVSVIVSVLWTSKRDGIHQTYNAKIEIDAL